MKTILVLIAIVLGIVFIPIPVFAVCAAPLEGPCFDSFTASHEEISEEFIMNHIYGYINVNYENWQMSEREWSNEDIGLDLPAIVCTEFVADGSKKYRMLQWVDSHTISDLENYRDDSLCDKWLPPQSIDLPICDQHPKHDFGKCQKVFQEPKFTLEQVLEVCKATGWVTSEHKSWWNSTHYVENIDCAFYDKVEGSPTYAQVIGSIEPPLPPCKSGPKPDGEGWVFVDCNWQQYVDVPVENCNKGSAPATNYAWNSQDCVWEWSPLRNENKSGPRIALSDEDVCGEGNVLVDGICMVKPKPSDFRDLQTGEAISNPHVIMIIQSLGAGLIVLFIAVYAIKRRKSK